MPASVGCPLPSSSFEPDKQLLNLASHIGSLLPLFPQACPLFQPSYTVKTEKQNSCPTISFFIALQPISPWKTNTQKALPRQNITVAELLSLKRLFGVSVLVILSRLRQLDVLPNVSMGPLWAMVNKLGWKDGRTAEPHALVPYQPNARLTRLVLRALSEDAIP